MWEWLMKKTNEIIRAKYNGSIMSTSYDDAIQEVMIYLLDNKKTAEKIYKEKAVGLLYSICKKTLYRLQSKVVFKDHTERVRYNLIRNICMENDIEVIPQNAYKVVAVIQNKKNISETSKKVIYTIPLVERMLGLEDDSITECRLIDG